MATARRRHSVVLGALAVLFAAASVIPAVAASSTSSPIAGITATRASIRASSVHTIDMRTVPRESAAALRTPVQQLPLLTGVSPQVWAQRKAAAAHARTRIAPHVYAQPVQSGNGPLTPIASVKFRGMADSGSICPYFGGCQPPDMAVAASTSFVLQGVNTSFAVYSTAGVIQAGWPKTAQAFFGVPNEPGCDPSHGNLPFLSDPRAFYDPVDNRFWAAVLQVEGAFGINSCPFLTKYWIAVSATSNPTGSYHVYSFDMSLGTMNAADYTQFGFHQTAMCFGGNMFNQPGTLYEYDEIFCALKAPMEGGSSVSAFGFTKLSVSGHLVDTVQPVETETQSYGGPNAALFINSFNMNGDPAGHNCVSTACHGVEVWAVAKPGTSSDSLTGAFIDTLTYISPPNADQPGCTKCVETIDTRITGTPPLHGGLITWSLDTGLSNGSQVVPMILWGQVLPTLNDAGALTGGALLQQGDFGFSGDGAAYFGALMPDVDGDLFMVFEHSSSSVNPEVDYTARRVNFTLGMFHDLGLVLQSGLARTFNTRWGDYEATSYDGSTANHVWIAGEFSGSAGDWATEIGRLQYTAGSN